MMILRINLSRCKVCLYNFRWNNLNRAYSNNNGEEWEPHIVAGIQPTGSLHVGHYFGVIDQCVKLQNAGQKVSIFIADLHSLTTTQEPARLRRRILSAAAALVASGVDPARSTLFVQSAAPAHASLCWALACVGTRARLEQLPQFRERAAATSHVPLGLLLYPVLQAADIAAQRGTWVAAGRDQAPHVQLAAALARAFASRYGAAFPAPRLLPPAAGDALPADRLLSLRDPARKMSKSDPDAKSRVLIADSDDLIRLKIRKAVTDFTPEVTWDPERRPGVSNLVRLHCLAAGLAPARAVAEARQLTTAQYKDAVAAALVARLGPVRERARRLEAEPGRLAGVLRAGGEAARARAADTYRDAARRMGVAAGGLAD